MSHTSDWLKETLDSILSGGKVAIDPKNTNESWLYNTVDIMYEKAMITEEAVCFFVLPSDRDHTKYKFDEIMKYKGDTSYQAISSRMWDMNEEYKELLGSKDGFYQAGLRPHGNWFDHKPIIVPALGDLSVISQLHDALRHRLKHINSPMQDDVARFSKSPIFIDNKKGFWTPYLENNFSEDELDALGDTGVHVVTANEDLKSEIKDHLSHVPDIDSSNKESSSIGVLVSTSNNKKIHELQERLNHLGVVATVIPVALIGARVKEAKEVSYTYSGNNSEKMTNAMAAIDEIGKGDLEDNLAQFGMSYDDTYILVEDRGLSIRGDLISGPEFEGFEHLMNPYRPGPGVELAHLLKGMSIEEFYDRAYRSAERLGIDKKDIYAMDIVSYQMQKISGEEKVVNAFGNTKNILHKVPEKDNDSEAVYSENYLTNTQDPLGRRNSSVKDYILKFSAVAKGVNSLLSAAGIKAERGVSCDANLTFSNEQKSDDGFNIVTQATAFPYITSSGIKGYSDKKLHIEQEFSLVAFEDRYNFVGQPEIFTLSQTSLDGGNSGLSTYQSTLNKVSRLLNDADAFVFGKTGINKRKIDPEELKVYEMFQFFSVVVGKQVFDPHIFKKSFSVVDGDWQECLDIYMDLHKQGLIGDKPEHIFYKAEDSEDALKHTALKRKEYVRLAPHETPRRESQVKFPDDDMYRVSVYCSATSTNPEKKDKARTLGYNLAKAGMGVVNGGGGEGLMEETSLGVLDFREKQNKGKEPASTKTFLKCIQCEETFRSEGMFEGADHSIVMPNIYLRMEELQDVEAEVVLSGGAGTVQEILGSIINRLNNRATVKNRPLIVVNGEADSVHQNDGVYDEVIKKLPQSIIERANIQVVENIDQAMDILLASRDEMGLSPSNDNTSKAGRNLKVV